MSIPIGGHVPPCSMCARRGSSSHDEAGLGCRHGWALCTVELGRDISHDWLPSPLRLGFPRALTGLVLATQHCQSLYTWLQARFFYTY